MGEGLKYFSFGFKVATFYKFSKIVNFTFLYILFHRSYAFFIFYIINYVALVSPHFKCSFPKTYELHSSFHHETGFMCCLTLAVFGEEVQFEIVLVIYLVIKFTKKLYLPMVSSKSNEGSRSFENDCFIKV